MIYAELIKWGLITALVSGTGALGISRIKNLGYEKAKAECVAQARDYESKLNARIDALVATSNTLVLESRENSAVLAADVDNILKRVRGKTLTIIKNGECTPSKEFSDSFVELNKRVNQSMKESRK